MTTNTQKSKVVSKLVTKYRPQSAQSKKTLCGNKERRSLVPKKSSNFQNDLDSFNRSRL